MSGSYQGDFTTANTVYVLFNTFDSNDPSGSVTLTGLAVTDIEIYKNGSIIQRSSDAGYTLLDTDGIDFDGTTGIHGFSIDLSDNTDAGFFAAGGEYTVVVASVTIDAGIVNFIACTFSIERTGGALALLKGANSLANIEDKIDIMDTNVDQIETAVITNAAGADVAADIIALKAETVLILADTAEIGTAGAGLTGVNSIVNAGSYEGGMVYIDTVGGVTGTTSYTHGTAVNPVATLAEAKTIADALNMTTFFVTAGSTVTLAATMAGYTFLGHSWTLALGSQAITGSTFIGAEVSGVSSTGSSPRGYFKNCRFTGATTLGLMDLYDCVIAAAITFSPIGASTVGWHRCSNGTNNAPATLTFDAGSIVNKDVNITDWQGELILNTMGGSAQTDTLYISGTGVLTESSATAGTVTVGGPFTVTLPGLTVVVKTLPELSVGAPDATPSVDDAIMLGYMALRNKVDITASAKEVHQDDGTLIATKTLSDDTTTYSETKMA